MSGINLIDCCKNGKSEELSNIVSQQGSEQIDFNSPDGEVSILLAY